MRFYVSSYRIPRPDVLEDLLGKSLRGARVALIMNAKDYYSEIPRAAKVAELTEYLEAFGCTVSHVDLRSYTDPAKLRADLSEADLVYVSGGNTYVLRAEMERSGFGTVIADVLRQEAAPVYVGESAGALVVGQAINGVELADEPDFAPEIFSEGLGLLPFVILPHADNRRFSRAAREFRAVHQNKHRIVELTDNEAIVIDGEKERIVSAVAPLRMFMREPNMHSLVRILDAFKIEPQSLLLLGFEQVSPDSFLWHLRVGNDVYYLYAEDFIESFAELKANVVDLIGLSNLEFIAVRRPQPFKSQSPVRSATVYAEPDDVDELAKYAVGSGPDFVFLAKVV